MIDVKHKKCLEENCNKRPTYNFQNQKKPTYCKIHKKENMIDICNKICIEENCTKRANFNYDNEIKALYCAIHKKENMIDIKHSKCLKCNEIRGNNKYKNYCFTCYTDLYPNEKFIFDKYLLNSKLRPDCYINKYTYSIIIECDEHQHKHISNVQENERINILHKSINKPVIFIRFNPDSYKQNDKKIMSSFKLHKESGNLIIRNEKEWNNRLNIYFMILNKFLINLLIDSDEDNYEDSEDSLIVMKIGLMKSDNEGDEE